MRRRGMVKRGKAEKRAARGERLSAALRENLKRRKQQARARDRGRAQDLVAEDIPAPAPGPDFRRNPDGE
jgi:hypothetical protein